jgi:hypothetical protein
MILANSFVFKKKLSKLMKKYALCDKDRNFCNSFFLVPILFIFDSEPPSNIDLIELGDLNWSTIDQNWE